MYCLWIGGKKVYNLKQLKENFDLESVEIYYCGGGLVRWLRLCGENETADRIEKIDASSDPTDWLAEIFSQPKPERKALPNVAASACAIKNNNGFDTSFTAEHVHTDGSLIANGKILDSFTGESLPPSSYGTTSLNGISSMHTGSFEAFAASFSLETASFSLETASFSLTSFKLTSSSFGVSSFHEFEYEYEAGGSFNAAGGSFSLGSFGGYKGSFTDTSFMNTSFQIEEETGGTAVSGERKEGGADLENGGNEADITRLSPNEKILQNITACPLNRFGYGLHLV